VLLEEIFPIWASINDIYYLSNLSWTLVPFYKLKDEHSNCWQCTLNPGSKSSSDFFFFLSLLLLLARKTVRSNYLTSEFNYVHNKNSVFSLKSTNSTFEERSFHTCLRWCNYKVALRQSENLALWFSTSAALELFTMVWNEMSAPKAHVLKARFPVQAVFRGGALEKWLDHEGSDFMNGLIHQYIQSLNRFLGGGGTVQSGT
jgi:hypothetical protein